MARITIVALLALVAYVQGSFTIDPNQPDGVYDYSPGSGNAARSIDPFKGRYHTKRTGDGVQCDQAGAVLASNDVEQARLALGPACDAGKDDFIPAYSGGQAGARYSKFGNALVYVCNYGTKTQHCTSAELNGDIAAIKKLCVNAAGYNSHFSDWKKSYGYADITHEIC